MMRSLAVDWGCLARHEHIFILGPTGIGKSYWAQALAHKACRDGYTVFNSRATSLFRDLAIARADGSLRTLLARFSRVEVLVIDDWAMAPLQESERRDFWEICEERYPEHSTILTSQLRVSQWHEQIGDPTLADGILDRLVHHAHASNCGANPCAKNAIHPETKTNHETNPDYGPLSVTHTCSWLCEVRPKNDLDDPCVVCHVPDLPI